MASASVTILVDVREASAGVVEALEARGVGVLFARLDVADYMVGEGVGAERKRVADLHESVASGRLWRQLTALQRNLDCAYLLVEGRDVDKGRLSTNGVRGALLEALDQGIGVIWSLDPADSAAWLHRLAVRAQRGAWRGPTRRRAYVRDATPAGLLTNVPGISVRTAAPLLDRFGSIAGIAASDTSLLRSVEGVGPERAAH